MLLPKLSGLLFLPLENWLEKSNRFGVTHKIGAFS